MPAEIFPRIMFLDYDGVVNIPMWNDKGTKCVYGQPHDNKVNDFQAVQWVSKFCEQCHYNIVVTSSWRFFENYAECLRNGGLRDGVKIVGVTKDMMPFNTRADEIKEYLREHPEIKYYVIADDEDWYSDDPEMNFHFVQSDGCRGFGHAEYVRCVDIFNKDAGHGGSHEVTK